MDMKYLKNSKILRQVILWYCIIQGAFIIFSTSGFGLYALIDGAICAFAGIVLIYNNLFSIIVSATNLILHTLFFAFGTILLILFFGYQGGHLLASLLITCNIGVVILLVRLFRAGDIS